MESDLSILIKGRSCEVNELNDIIASLEFKLKATEATNVSLRDLIKTKISNSKQNEIFHSNTVTKNDKQCAVNHVEQSNLVLNRVLGEKNSPTDLAQKSDVTPNLVVSNNRRVDKDLSVKDNQLILNSDNSPADVQQSHNNNLINGAKSHDGQHMKGNSNARKLPNITDLKSLLQVPGVSATMNEVDNKVDTYPIIDGHHCSLRNVSSSTFNVLKDIEFLPLISLNESLEYNHQVPVDFKRPFQENPGRKPPPSIVRSHQRSPEWLNHLASPCPSINERVISPNTADINYPKNINIITQRSNKINLNSVPSIELVYKIPTRITVRRNNLCVKTRPRTHARKVNVNNLVCVNFVSNPKPDMLRFATINARSLRNKVAVFSDYIVDQNIDVCVVTETWLKDMDTTSIAGVCLPGYSFKSFPRQSNRSGGGSGVMFNTNLYISLSGGGETKSFEYSERNFSILEYSIKLIAIYRPPYSAAHPVLPGKLFEEFSNYLEDIVLCLLITGDFNFHLDDTVNRNTIKFNEMLETFGLKQHVCTPTHSSNHTLDLLISRSTSDINILSIESTFFLSDHCFVECKLSIPRPNDSKKLISYRELKKINIADFKLDLSNVNSHCKNIAHLDELVHCYDDVLSRILNTHAPVRRKLKKVKRSTPWYNDELRQLKVKRRRLERKMRKTKLEVDWTAYRKICNRYCYLLNKARTDYYTSLISDSSNDPKNLYRIESSLCNAPHEDPLPPHDDLGQLANRFNEYFFRKIELIRENVDSIHVDPPLVHYRNPEVKLESFEILSSLDIHDVIMQLSSAICKLDPIPSWLVKICCLELIPSITKIVHLSLQEGRVPDHWKIALLKPNLKKSSLDPVFENFRPVSNLSFLSKIT